jgi:hypothetical protein
LQGLPIVKFVCGVEETIKPVRWVFKVSGGLMLARKQVPLRLAWAISIHKSQVGTSLFFIYLFIFLFIFYGVGLGRMVREVRQHPEDHRFESQRWQ